MPSRFFVQNGILGKQELMNHFNNEVKFKLSDEEATELMDHLDDDGNGVIDLNELEVSNLRSHVQLNTQCSVCS